MIPETALKGLVAGEEGDPDRLAQGVSATTAAGTDVVAKNVLATEAQLLLQDNRIDAFFCTVGHPSGAERGYYTKTTLPVSEFYKGAENGADVDTFGVIATMCTSSRVPDHVVYSATKALFDNFDHFRKQHPALAGLTREGMLGGLTAPLHPGAIRYFMEAGLIR